MAHADELPLAIVERIAEREGVTPVDFRPPLYETIDTDALESLLGSGSESVSVSFPYRSHAVTVDGTGAVRIADSETSESRASAVA